MCEQKQNVKIGLDITQDSNCLAIEELLKWNPKSTENYKKSNNSNFPDLDHYFKVRSINGKTNIRPFTYQLTRIKKLKYPLKIIERYNFCREFKNITQQYQNRHNVKNKNPEKIPLNLSKIKKSYDFHVKVSKMPFLFISNNPEPISKLDSSYQTPRFKEESNKESYLELNNIKIDKRNMKCSNMNLELNNSLILDHHIDMTKTYDKIKKNDLFLPKINENELNKLSEKVAFEKSKFPDQKENLVSKYFDILKNEKVVKLKKRLYWGIQNDGKNQKLSRMMQNNLKKEYSNINQKEESKKQLFWKNWKLD